MNVYRVDVTILVIADSEDEACDGMSAMLSESHGPEPWVFDWAYQRTPDGTDFTLPELVNVHEPYEEGDYFNQHGHSRRPSRDHAMLKETSSRSRDCIFKEEEPPHLSTLAGLQATLANMNNLDAEDLDTALQEAWEEINFT